MCKKMENENIVCSVSTLRYSRRRIQDGSLTILAIGMRFSAVNIK